MFSHRIADQLSPHHDSQFSAFSTKGFIRINQKDNRSSSPFTTLADKTERKVTSTGARQPNYWPKTWFGADAYNAIFGAPNYTVKSVRTCCKRMERKGAPGELSRTKVYGCNR